jgi:hypothetical protein
MTTNTQDSGRREPTHAQGRSEKLEGANLDDAQGHHGGLFCIAVGTDPAGREHRVKIREADESFVMIDSRRRCRVHAHWACRLSERDIVKEVAFVFRVKVNSFEYPDIASVRQVPARREKQRKAKYWNSWGRRTTCTPNAMTASDTESDAAH